MPNRPLTITSTTNAHALVNYLGAFVLGIALLVSEGSAAYNEFAGDKITVALATLLAATGAAAFATSVATARKRDPTSSLGIEFTVLVPLVLIFGSLLWSYLAKYDFSSAVVPIVVIAFWGLACFCRAIQCWLERRNLVRARSSSLPSVEVPAEPDKR